MTKLENIDINSCVVIVVQHDDKTFNIYDSYKDKILFKGIKYLELALGMREAYCVGYDDGKKAVLEVLKEYEGRIN